MVSISKEDKKRLSNFAALCAWLIVSISMAFIAFTQFGQDFRGYYAAARVLLNGGNPYDYFQVAPILQAATGQAGNNPFYYPLWFGWFITPFALLPYQMARALWMLLNLATWTFALLRLRSFLEFPRRGWPTWCLHLLATFVFAWMTWKFEQTGILLFLITVEVLIAYKNKQWNRMGIFLVLSLIKPNIMLAPVAIISLWLIRNKMLRPVIVMSTVLTGLILLSTILTPHWYEPILQPNFGQGLTEVLDGPGVTTGIRLNTTLIDWLGTAGIPHGIRNMIYGTTIGACVILCAHLIWKSESFLQTVAISLLINFVATPYALQYDFPPLAIVLYWLLAIAFHMKTTMIPILLIAFITSVLFWEHPISDGYWIILGLCALAVWVARKAKGIQLPENLR